MIYSKLHTVLPVLSVIVLGGYSTIVLADDQFGSRDLMYDASPINAANRWAGFYAGVGIQGTGILTEVDRGAGAGKLDSGVLALGFSAHAGYNFTPQLDAKGNGVMFGVEADLTPLWGYSNTVTDATLGDTDFTGEFVASARGRAGYVWNNLYLYATAGVALTDASAKPKGKDESTIGAGIAYGVGAEYALNDNWTGRLEVINYNFMGRDVGFGGVNKTTTSSAAQVRAALSMKF